MNIKTEFISDTTTAATVNARRRRNALIVIGIILVASNLRASITSVGPLVGAIHATTGLSGELIGLITTLPLLGFAVLSPIIPRLARRYGMEFTLLVSLVGLLSGILVRSLPSTTALFVGTALLGLSIAIGNVLLPSLVKRDFPTNAGLMIGVYSTFMGTWAAVASGVSIPVSHRIGWRGGLGCWAILAVLGILVWLPQLRSAHRLPAIKEKVSERQNIWRSPLAWQVTLFMGLQSLLFYVTITWLPEILQSGGMSAASAGWMLSLTQFVSLPATLIVAAIAGRRRSQRGMVAIIATLGLVGFIGLSIFGTKFVALWIVLIGLTLGASISLALTLFTLRTRDPHQSAELSGMAQSVGYLLAAVGPVLFGFLHDMTHAWGVPLMTLVATTVLLLFAGLGAGRDAYVTDASKI